jgi:hypothetical protein
MAGYRNVVGVAGANVDVETAVRGIENPRDHHIFEILRI